MVKIIEIEEDYKPSENEEYMNPKQLEYFRRKLLKWREELEKDSLQTLKNLREESWNEPDKIDRATLAHDVSVELKTKDRVRKLIEKIDIALDKIANNQYGYCEETGEKIGVKRLDARPIATLTIDAQERHESFERSHNEDVL